MPFRAFATPKQHRQPSLFGEILDWMMAPLMILWPISMAVEYALAYSVANTTYDRELRNELVVFSRQLTYQDGRVALSLADAARQILVADELAEAGKSVRRMEEELALLKEARVMASDRSQATQAALVHAFNSAAERIEGLSKKLNQTLGSDVAMG